MKLDNYEAWLWYHGISKYVVKKTDTINVWLDLSIVALTGRIIRTQLDVSYVQNWMYHTYRTSGDQRCTFLCSSGGDIQCLLLQIKFCTLNHILTLLHYKCTYRTVSSMSDYCTLAKLRFCILNSCHCGVGNYISDILETTMWLWILN
jgi:hypothetical protein